MPRRALITGITGQDGQYLARLLLARGYEVHGQTRRHPEQIAETTSWISQDSSPRLHQAELTDEKVIIRLLEAVQPAELYHLAGQSSVTASWRQPLLTAESNALAAARLLEAVRLVDPQIRFFQAGSSEMFGQVEVEPQDEQTPFRPRNPYGVAKLHAHWTALNYREQYGLFTVNGILFNHESPLRGSDFVSRKITAAVARIKLGLIGELRLGDLESRRDWGFAGDFVRAMWLSLQHDQPSDYVIATSVQRSVRDFVRAAFAQVDLDANDSVVIDPSLFRPAEHNRLRGDASKARRELGWEPEINFDELVAMMVEADLRRVEHELVEARV